VFPAQCAWGKYGFITAEHMNGTVFIKDKKLNDVTIVDNTFIAGFMAGAPELALKAYLYGLMLLSSHASADTDVAAAWTVRMSNALRAA